VSGASATPRPEVDPLDDQAAGVIVEEQACLVLPLRVRERAALGPRAREERLRAEQRAQLALDARARGFSRVPRDSLDVGALVDREWVPHHERSRQRRERKCEPEQHPFVEEMTARRAGRRLVTTAP
jgi:hypothetical protein